MNQFVRYCVECPFFHLYSAGDYWCVNKGNESGARALAGYDVYEVPEWCPLKENPVLVQLK